LHKESLERRENRDLVEKVIAQVCHASLRINFILTEAQQSNRPLDNPVLKSVLEAFDGRVIKEE